MSFIKSNVCEVEKDIEKLIKRKKISKSKSGDHVIMVIFVSNENFL
jgi:hypothetical protein